MKDVIAVILAGGIGKRFWPLTTPKALVDFLGKPLIVHNLEFLKIAGIKEVILIVPSGERSFTLPEISGINVETVVQTRPLGMGDAMLTVEKAVKGRPMLVMNATDVVEESFYREVSKRIHESKMFMAGKKVSTYYDVGYLKFINSKITEIVEKPGKGKEPSEYINFVFDYFPEPSDFFDTLRKTITKNDDAYEQALSSLLKVAPAEMLAYDGFWQPLKYPWQVLDLLDYYLNHKLTEHRGKNVEIRDNVFIEGPVWLGDNVRIFENSKIVGPCFIGDNTVIGNNNVIRHSQIGENTVTGFNTDITRSYIGGNCWFHCNYIGDSIIESNVSLGSGTVLANLRLDEGEISSAVRGQKFATGKNKLGVIIGRDTRVGVNSSIMPGVKIGGNSLVGAGLVIDKDIPENSFCLGKSELVIEKNIASLAKKSREKFRRLF